MNQVANQNHELYHKFPTANEYVKYLLLTPSQLNIAGNRINAYHRGSHSTKNQILINEKRIGNVN